MRDLALLLGAAGIVQVPRLGCRAPAPRGKDSAASGPPGYGNRISVRVSSGAAGAAGLVAVFSAVHVAAAVLPAAQALCCLWCMLLCACVFAPAPSNPGSESESLAAARQEVSAGFGRCRLISTPVRSFRGGALCLTDATQWRRGLRLGSPA